MTLTLSFDPKNHFYVAGIKDDLVNWSCDSKSCLQALKNLLEGNGCVSKIEEEVRKELKQNKSLQLEVTQEVLTQLNIETEGEDIETSLQRALQLENLKITKVLP